MVMIENADVTLHVTGVDDAALAALQGRLHVDVIVHADDPHIETLLASHRLRVRLERADACDARDDAECHDSDSLPCRSAQLSGDAGAGAGADDADRPVAPVSASETIVRTVVIAMESTSLDAEALFRSAIVALDSMPGNQVEGISPLYHVGNLDGPDGMSAVLQMTTHMGIRHLAESLADVAQSIVAHSGGVQSDIAESGTTQYSPAQSSPAQYGSQPTAALPLAASSAAAAPSHSDRQHSDDRLVLRLISADAGGRAARGADGGPLQSDYARGHASVLAPWMDMDVNAALDGDPVSFLLAMAPDAGRVGLLSDAWIIGGSL